MEKVLTFSSEQKNLIWQRFVQPAGGTEAEVKQFIEVCETFGLNPLLNDIVFQRYETRQGPRTNFITTRDGLLRVASQQPDYVGAPNANVVREGDEFEFVPSEGDVVHKFGKKRGKILGAYAVMYHKRFRPVSVFVDYEEYANANAKSRGGKSPIWDSMPSAMIQKVAEVFVLKRQFPLGGLLTAEEMGIDDFGDNDHGDLGSAQPVKTPKNPSSDSSAQSKAKSQNEHTSEEKQKPEKSKEETAAQSEQEQSKKSKQQKTEKTEQKKEEEKPSSNRSSDGGQYVLEKYESGTSPSGVPFAKITVKDQESGEMKLVLAKDQEAVDLTCQIPEEEPFDMEIREENGFLFFEGVNGLKAGQAAS